MTRATGLPLLVITSPSRSRRSSRERHCSLNLDAFTCRIIVDYAIWSSEMSSGNMEREMGLEPTTSSLGSWHSTTELLPPWLTRWIGEVHGRGTIQAISLARRPPPATQLHYSPPAVAFQVRSAECGTSRGRNGTQMNAEKHGSTAFEIRVPAAAGVYMRPIHTLKRPTGRQDRRARPIASG